MFVEEETALMIAAGVCYQFRFLPVVGWVHSIRKERHAADRGLNVRLVAIWWG
jgi:hypothetical protein